MPIQTLGLFDRIFNWIYDKLLSPVINWLSEVLGNIFKYIFETILLPFLQTVFGTLWKAIAAPILNFFYRGIYAIYSGLLWIVDLVQQGFDVLIGLKNVSYYDEATGEVLETTLLNYILFDESIRNVLIAVTFVAVALCIAFSIYAVMRSSLDFDFENKRPVGKVLTMTAKSMLTFLMIPLIVWVGLNLASHALVATATALSGGQSTSLSDTILAISSMDAGVLGSDEFSMNNSPWSDLMNGTLGVFTFPLYINISEIDYLVGFSSAIFCLIIMIMCLFTFIRRIYDIVVLYIVSPYFASTMVLDDGQKFNSWRDAFIGKVMIGFGSAIGMRIFLMLVPIIMGDEIQLFDSVLMNATGGYVLKLIFVLGGMYAVYKSSSLLTSIVNSRIGMEEAMGNSRMLHGMAAKTRMVGGAAASALKGSFSKKPSQGNKLPIPAASPSGLNTGAPSAKLTTGFKANGATGATAEQSKEWQKALGGFDPDSDYSKTKNMHIRDVEDMSESLQNLFGDDIVRGNDVEDMSAELSNMFDEGPGLEAFIKDDYSADTDSKGTGAESRVSTMGDLSSFIKDDYFAESKTSAADSKTNSGFDLSSFPKDDYSTDTGSKGTGTESRGSVTGDLSSFVMDDYSAPSEFGSLSVGGKEFKLPEGYVAMPKIVPAAKAQARVQQMKQTGGAQFGAYYDAVSSQMKKGSYSTPAMSSNVSQIQSVSSVGGKQLHVPAGYTVVPEIMKVSDATVAASSIRGGKNQEFYSAFTSAINSPKGAASAPAPTSAAVSVPTRISAPTPAPAPKITTSLDIASLEAKIQTNTSDK